ncbi:ABC transporter ATP-binding protein [Rhodovibrio sodomensis]|uniref:ABC transporter ATP-binding protein n=1 Tax=Rhodovibrio sodomensis TaxID=1088 RepID=A0ABS1DDJ9_9PROT|nr:ABC transporter ATP-binding protein [Rhodovibrio sodomensis]
MSLTSDKPDAETAALEVDNVRYAFGDRVAVDDIGFRIAPGTFTIMLGLNGAGKTTLFSLITRLFVARQGRVRIFGYDVARQSSQALSRLGVVFQQPTLDQDLTVRQSLRYHGRLHGLSRREIRERSERELARIGLADRLNDRVRALSGGQRRRIEIARALLHRPQLMLLDEPTVGLDVDSRTALLSYARKLCREDGVAMLWATHLIDEVDPDDPLLVLHRGRLEMDGRARELCRAQGTDEVAGAFQKLTGVEAG